MCDCFPKIPTSQYEIKFPQSDPCKVRTGESEYKDVYRQFSSGISSLPTAGDGLGDMSGFLNQICGNTSNPNSVPNYSFSKGPRFGVPPYCDCTPPPERFRFSTTYQNDFMGKSMSQCNPNQKISLPGVPDRRPIVLPPQHLCPFTTESTYSRAFDMTQPYFNDVCSQQEACGGSNQAACDTNSCSNPVQGLTISFKTPNPRRQVPPLNKDDLVKPGTDTMDCPRCPRPIPCCPCEDSSRLCDACCGCEFPCKLHQAAATPMRKYPIILNTPRYVPDPRDPPLRPKLLCHGGTCECPLQSSFPTSAAINQAHQRLIEKLAEERCTFPPECVESTYRASFKTPPIKDCPKYCSAESIAEVHRANKLYACKGEPPHGFPAYCMDGGRPPDPRPMFDHLSTYEADYIWNVVPRFKLLGGEIPCSFEQKPLCCPCKDASEFIKPRTEEKERWGDDWLCNPQPAP